MADGITDDEETEIVTFTASRECAHFRAEVTIQMAENADPQFESKMMTNLSNALRGAAGFIPNPEHAMGEHIYTQVLEAPTPESIDNAVENFRIELQKHLTEHHRHEGKDGGDTPQD